MQRIMALKLKKNKFQSRLFFKFQYNTYPFEIELSASLVVNKNVFKHIEMTVRSEVVDALKMALRNNKTSRKKSEIIETSTYHDVILQFKCFSTDQYQVCLKTYFSCCCVYICTRLLTILFGNVFFPSLFFFSTEGGNVEEFGIVKYKT